jgi:hypothetical protein
MFAMSEIPQFLEKANSGKHRAAGYAYGTSQV